MSLPNKLQLPDLYIEEMQEYIRISNKATRTTSGQATYQNPRTLASYTTVGSAYDNQGEQGLGLLLYNVSPNLKQYVFDNTTYDAMKTAIIANTKGTSDYFVTTGTQPNYVVTTGESYVSLPDGFKITIKPHADSVGTVTLNVDGIGAINCLTQEGETIVLFQDKPMSLRFNGTNFIQPSSGGLGTFFGDGSDGTIPNLNTVTTAPNGGTVANLWDMNAGTSFITNSIPSDVDYVIASIDLLKTQYISNLTGTSDFRGFVFFLASTSASNRTLALQFSDNGIDWTQCSVTRTITTTPTTYAISSDSGQQNHRYWRVVLKSGGNANVLTIRNIGINVALTEELTTTFRILEPSTLNGAAVVKQYTDYLLPVGYEHTVQNPCQGLVIYSQNDIVVNGIIDMSQKAGLAPNGNAIPMLISKKAYKTAKTSSLLHFDNNITDANGRVWTNNGGATFDATNKKFGTHAISFNGTNQWIDTPASDDFSFGNEDFTIDFWVRPTTTGTQTFLCGSADSSNNYGSVLVLKNSSNIISVLVYKQGSSSSSYSILGTTTLASNTFYHVAVVRVGDWLKLYVNGILDGAVFVGSDVLQKVSNKFSIGRNGEATVQYFAGQIDEFRIIKGKAMYTANFTPPTSAYTYQATYVDEPKTLEKYFQLTNVLQTLRGGCGGNGGYGGSYNPRTIAGGIGGSGRQNLGGFGGGGGGAGIGSTNGDGGIGGSITNSELGGGESSNIFLSGQTVTDGVFFIGANATNGAGGRAGGRYASNILKISKGGTCFGGGGGGGSCLSGNQAYADGQNGEYAGSFVCLIINSNVTINGRISANGGKGGNGANNTTTFTAGGGGGGGGSGGGVVSIFHKGNYTNNGTIEVNGGTGGAGGTPYTGGVAGGSGTSGSVGTIHIQQL